jgi:hypothetical protein
MYSKITQVYVKKTEHIVFYMIMAYLLLSIVKVVIERGRIPGTTEHLRVNLFRRDSFLLER